MLGPNVLIRGPVSIGKKCKLSECYIGPYTSLGDGCIIENSEIEHSIIFEQASIQNAGRIVDSIIGQKAKVTDAKSTLPRGNKLIIGDNSVVEL